MMFGMYDDLWNENQASRDKIKSAISTLINSGCFNKILKDESSEEFKALMSILHELNFHTTDLISLMKSSENF